jgi:hypothetical protein
MNDFGAIVAAASRHMESAFGILVRKLLSIFLETENQDKLSKNNGRI